MITLEGSNNKFCRDCKWSELDHSFNFLWVFPTRNSKRFSKCTHPKINSKPPSSEELFVDPSLNKSLHSRSIFCTVAREGEHLCGPEAKFYEKA